MMLSLLIETEISHEILEAAEGYTKNFIKLMLSTGIKVGEIIALKWGDVDFQKQTIKILKELN